MPTEFRRWRRKFKQYFLGSDLGVTHISGQQAAPYRCVEDIEQHLYNTRLATTRPSSRRSPTRSNRAWTLSMNGSPSNNPWTQDAWSFSSSRRNWGNQWSPTPTGSPTWQTNASRMKSPNRRAWP